MRWRKYPLRCSSVTPTIGSLRSAADRSVSPASTPNPPLYVGIAGSRQISIEKYAMLGAAPLVSFMKPMLMGLLLQRILCQLVQKSDRFGWRSQLVAPKKNFAWLSFGQGVAEPHLVFDRVAHELDDATGHNRLPSSGKLVAQPHVVAIRFVA